jgi:hypothetical protein
LVLLLRPTTTKGKPLFTYTVQAGDNLSVIAELHGESLATIENDNPQFSADWNLIYVGQKVALHGHSHFHGHLHSAASPAALPSAPQATVPVVPAPAVQQSGFSIPGMPQSLTDCIAFRESTNGTNPAANGNVFGIIPASGYNVAGDSVAQQEQVAGQIYASVGGQAWAADGCPGT